MAMHVRCIGEGGMDDSGGRIDDNGRRDPEI